MKHRYNMPHGLISTYVMKSTKVQTLGEYTAYLAYYANAHALKLATPRVVVVVVLSVLAPTLASGISRHHFG